MALRGRFGLTFLVLCFAGVLIPSSASPFSFEAVQDALKERFRRQDDHGHGHEHEDDHEGENSEQFLSVPCHTESELIEVFNELAMDFNISDPEVNKTCVYVGNSSHSDDHHEGDDHDHEEDGHEEEVSPFCANAYSVIREMGHTLNNTTPSCLITESEIIEVFNELAVVFNISDTEVNKTCFYVKEGNSSHSEDHHEGEDDHDDEEEVPPFCANVYSLIREMVLTLNNTTPSCLITESEIIEVVDELAVVFNISDPEVNETCFYEDDHDHMGEDDHDHKEEVTPFCANMYFMIRKMVLTLNYTTESCLMNGTTGSSTGDPEVPSPRSDPGLAYGIGFVAVMVVSFVALIGVLTVPLVGKKVMIYVSAFLVAMGISALASDAILHLIPHSFLASSGGGHVHEEEGGHSGEFEIIWKGSVLLGTILVFYIFEFVMKYWRDRSKKKMKRSKKEGSSVTSVELTDASQNSPGSGEEGLKEVSNQNDSVEEAPCDETQDQEDDRPHYYNPNQGFCHGIVPVAWIIIIGDAFHNFADGLAIGAAYSSSIGGGLSTTLAVLFHEIPHELGDYAILLSTGMKWYIAAFYNLVSALTAVVGMFIGVAIGNVSEVATSWIFVIAAGIFLYVALVDMLPALFETKYRTNKQRWIHFTLHMCGFLFAYALLVVLAVYEHQLESLIVI